MAYAPLPMFPALADRWWMIGLRGLLGVLFGLLAFAMPLPTLVALVWLFGLYAFLDGLFSLAAAWRRRPGDPPWWALLLSGAAGVAAGMISFVWPGITALALVYLIAAWAFITGLFQVAAAIRLRKEIEGEWMLGLSGILSVGLGVLLAVMPGAGAIGLVWYFGAYALLFGVVLMVLSYRLRSHRQRLQSDGRRLAA